MAGKIAKIKGKKPGIIGTKVRNGGKVMGYGKKPC